MLIPSAGNGKVGTRAFVVSGIVACRPARESTQPTSDAAPRTMAAAPTTPRGQPAPPTKPEAETALDLGAIDPSERVSSSRSSIDCVPPTAARLWGASVCGPMLFVDPQSRAVVGNHALTGHLRPQGTLFAGRLPDDMVVAKTAVQWGGRAWTMVIWWSLAAESKPRNRLLAHEAFHRVQPDLDLAPAGALPVHLDEEAGRVWLQLEWNALQRALLAEGEDRLVVSGGLILEDNATNIARLPSKAGAANAGDGWALELADGFVVVPGSRSGDFTIAATPP